ncbi:MAG TPA: hypothetical protein VGL99_33930 [Chloroflexota bacterium]
MRFEDGYIGLAYDGVTRQQQFGTFQGNRIVEVLGQRAAYYHVLNTSLVRTGPAPERADGRSELVRAVTARASACPPGQPGTGAQSGSARRLMARLARCGCGASAS